MSSFTTSNAFNCPITAPQELQNTILTMMSMIEQQHNIDSTTQHYFFPSMLIEHIVTLINLVIQQDLINNPLYDIPTHIAPLITLLLKYHILPQVQQSTTSSPSTVTRLDRQIYTAVIFLVNLSPILRTLLFDISVLDNLSLESFHDSSLEPDTPPTFQQATLWNQMGSQ